MSRPTKLTPELQAIICKAIEGGATYTAAAGYARIDYDTFKRWMVAGEAARSGRFSEFYGAVKHAEAKCFTMMANAIARAAADGDWRAAMEYLKRRDREHWGDNVDVTSKGERVNVDLVWRTFNEGDDGGDGPT